MKKELSSKKVLLILYWFNLISFAVPTVYVAARIFILKSTALSAENPRPAAEYILMLIQCIFGIVILHLPAMLERRFNFALPDILTFIYLIFLYCAIFLGEVRSFYYTVPHWDDILHSLSSVMNGLFGFLLVAVLNRNQKVSVNLSPFFISLFAFCFSVSVGAVWEIYEYLSDGILGLNMQKFMLRGGEFLVGQSALKDTMTDLIFDCFGALFATVIGYFSIKHKKGNIHKYLLSHFQNGKNSE